MLLIMDYHLPEQGQQTEEDTKHEVDEDDALMMGVLQGYQLFFHHIADKGKCDSALKTIHINVILTEYYYPQ